MIFEGNDPYYRKSDCGRYAIAKIYVEGKMRYEASHKVGRVWEFLAQNLPSFGEAARQCEAHAESSTTPRETADV
jgi:hypothetical protein